jgi:Holliday junction resolvase-like predicted endonuclease
MSLTTIRQLTVKSEAELEQLLSECPAAIGKGVQILERQVPASRGFIDILAVDADNENALVVIELKKESDDRVLTQGLEYYDFVRDNIERFAQIYPDHKINAHVEPRLLLIAGSFNPSVLAAARYVDVPLTLYTYTYLSLGDKQGLYLMEVDVPPRRDLKARRLPVGEHVAYITDDVANQACQQVIDWLKQLDPEYRISVKYKGNNFVNIHTRRSYFHISWRPDWKGQKISSLDDFTDEIKDQLRQCLTDMGGLPPDVDEIELEEQD